MHTILRQLPEWKASTAKTRVRLALAIGFLVSFSGVLAGVVPGRWEKIDTLRIGTPLRVTLKSGHVFEGLLEASAQAELQILLPGAGARAFPKTEISRIETQHKVADSVGNGVAAGAGVGLAMSLWALLRDETGVGDFSPASGVVFSGLIGAGIGYLIDKSVERPETLFVARSSP